MDTLRRKLAVNVGNCIMIILLYNNYVTEARILLKCVFLLVKFEWWNRLLMDQMTSDTLCIYNVQSIGCLKVNPNFQILSQKWYYLFGAIVEFIYVNTYKFGIVISFLGRVVYFKYNIPS